MCYSNCTMNNFERLVSKKISETIKQARIKQNISQKALAEDICSQGMISSIEHGDYIPNTAIFLAICSKLNLSVDKSFLKEKLNFSNNIKLSDTAFKLCKEHQYTELIKYLDQQNIIASLNTNLDFQIYYYYYGCSVYQISHDLLACKHYFKIALTYSMNSNYLQPRTPIELLLLNSLGVSYAELKRDNKADMLFKTVNKFYSKCQNADSENLNVIQYQQASIYFEQEKYQLALDLLLSGLTRLNRLNSTFMLSNYSSKILECYGQLKKSSN